MYEIMTADEAIRLIRDGDSICVNSLVRQAVDDADPAAESSGDQQSVGLGLAGGRRHDTGEFFRGDLKVHLRLQSCPDDG